jgi:hypothetical protein
MELSPIVLFSDTESVIDLEITTAGNVVAANAAAPPISMSRRLNLPIRPLPLALDNRFGCYALLRIKIGFGLC